MKKSTFRLFLSCFCLFLGQNTLFSDEKDQEPLPQRKPNPNFVSGEIAVISTQKQLDALKVTEKQRQDAILELVDGQKLIAERQIIDANAANALLDRVPKTNLSTTKLITKGRFKGYQAQNKLTDYEKELMNRNSQVRQQLDSDVMVFTRDAQYSLKGDFVATRAAIIKTQKNLRDTSEAFATGRMFAYPVKLPMITYPGQICSLVGGREYVSVSPEKKLTDVVTVKINHAIPGKHPLKQYYHLIGWPSDKSAPRANKDTVEAAFPHVDTEAVVLVGDIVNIHGKQGITLSYIFSLDEAGKIATAAIRKEIQESPVAKKEK